MFAFGDGYFGREFPMKRRQSLPDAVSLLSDADDQNGES
jgi:hypothetical protein